MKGWNLKMSLPNHLCLVKSWLRFASQLQLAKLCFQTEIQLLINNLCKWVCHSLEILAVSSNQDIRIYKMPPYLCYRNFTLHSDCLGIVTIPEIYKYVSSLAWLNDFSHSEQVWALTPLWVSIYAFSNVQLDQMTCCIGDRCVFFLYCGLPYVSSSFLIG